jgi:hypothetical protein
MMSKICPALINENYEYMLSGDCSSYCTCMINNRRCVGFKVEDPEDRSSQFFSRGKNVLDEKAIKKCPVYGSSAETIASIIKEKHEKELKEKLNNLQ